MPLSPRIERYLTEQRKATERLRSLVSTSSTKAIVEAAERLFYIGPAEAGRRFGLSSPLREAFFLLGTMLVTPEPISPKALNVQQLFESLEHVVQSQVRPYFDVTNPSDHDTVHVAAVRFMQKFLAGRLRTAEQVADRISGLLAPFDNELRSMVGISATDALAFANHIVSEMQRGADIATGAVNMGTAIFREPEKRQRELFLEFRKTGWIFPHAVLSARFSSDLVSAFFSTFRAVRGQELQQFEFFDPNPFEARPLVDLGQGEFSVPLSNQMFEAIFDRMTQALESSGDADRYFRARGRWLEKKTLDVISPLFKNDAHLLCKACDEPGTNEHDIVVVYRRSLIVIECKAGAGGLVMRVPERAFARAKQQFQSAEGIQGGFVQIMRVVDKLQQSGSVEFFNRKSEHIATIKTSDIDDFFGIVVTNENFGMLGTDLTIFLEKPEYIDFPWAIEIADFESLVAAWIKRGFGPNEFLDFLRQRRARQGVLVTSDELDIAAAFLLYDSLNEFPTDRNTPVIIEGSGYASIFDDIYNEKHGGPPASFKPMHATPTLLNAREEFAKAARVPQEVLAGMIQGKKPKVGRNDLCPCGSNVKFKKCHGTT